ncbi:aminotransferase class IV [Caldimonas brevitalea]|uniref:branched-chain-amino-acid transaminase n=1 Tax=Caldimonas brevitalea TaxID=413882 RepID=A0A0G3BRH9_9BURK|nr:aminotransferase class IV [Caldimonas brevitalea]AKJ32022.1 branched-chain amino acid aminotransferase [Caldimonas brevitalea]
MQVFIDGAFYGEDDAKVSIFDHGFLYGNGVFTTLMAIDDMLCFVDDHLDRLFESARLVRIPIPWSRDQVRHWLYQTHERNLELAGRKRIRLNISRGVGPEITLEHGRYCRPVLSIIVSRYPQLAPEVAARGMSVCCIEAERVLPKAKSFNFLPSVLAYEEARERGYDDALFVDRHGEVTEATSGNVFCFLSGRLRTPARMMLEGVTRKHVLGLARASGLPVVEAALSRTELERADEMFVTGTTKPVVPVTRLDGRPVGRGRPGACTLALHDLLTREMVRRHTCAASATAAEDGLDAWSLWHTQGGAAVFPVPCRPS